MRRLGSMAMREALRSFGVAVDDVPSTDQLIPVLQKVLTHPALDANPTLRHLAERALFTATDDPSPGLIQGYIQYLGKRSANDNPPAVGRPKRQKSNAPMVVVPRAVPTIDRTNATQRGVLAHFATRSKALADEARPKLETRILSLGYTKADYDRFFVFFRRSAPITINFEPDRSVSVDGVDAPIIDGLRRHGRYKNQFETKVSGSPVASGGDEGGTRDNAEARIFDGRYHDHPLVPDERPIYAALNAELAAYGGASGYGISHLVLNPNIRSRCTITARDSLWDEPDNVGTFEHCEHVLMNVHDDKLTGMIDVAIGRSPRGRDHDLLYFEVQVHGPLDMDQDVGAAVIWNQVDQKSRRSARALAKTNDFDLFWTNGVDVAAQPQTLSTVTIKQIKAAKKNAEESERRTFDWMDPSRTVLAGAEAPVLIRLHPQRSRQSRGWTVRNRPGAGWYEGSAGVAQLVKFGPPRQLQAELFGSYLWRRCGLPAAEVKRTIVKSHGAGTATAEIPDAVEVSSSWNDRQTNAEAIQSLTDDFSDADDKLIRATVLDIITSNMDGQQSVMRDARGVCFIDFGGTIHARPRGEPKDPEHFNDTPDVAAFLGHLKKQIGDTHPIFSVSETRIRDEARALIDEGLFTFFDEAATYASLRDDPESTWTASGVIERLKTRARALADRGRKMA